VYTIAIESGTNIDIAATAELALIRDYPYLNCNPALYEIFNILNKDNMSKYYFNIVLAIFDNFSE
jgi:hypothetical protein